MTPAVLVAVAGLFAAAPATDAPAIRIVSPAPESVLSGPTRLAVAVTPDAITARVQAVNFFVDGRLVCTVERAPFACSWDAGTTLREHHVRVVATLEGGARLVANLRTKDVGYAERVRTDAVLVPAVVKSRGQFVRGLKLRDFELLEDGTAQRLASVASEDAPLDLVIAVDISGSMEAALPDVRLAVKRLLSKLRPGDAVTLIGFNDTSFIVAERETDPTVRADAVDLLSAWGGTALYDATLRALDLVGRDWGRKGVVIFSDGDDRNSLVGRKSALSRVQASDAVLYTVGFGSGATVPQLRTSLQDYATVTGGRAFFPQNIPELDAAFESIVSELAHQYVLSYAPLNAEYDGKWRSIKVRVRNGNYDIRARAGYRLDRGRLAERAVR
jgi:Ca-activated chloride channel family protein